MMKVKYAAESDYDKVREIDNSITLSEFRRWADNSQVLLIYEQDEFAGWLQYSYFKEKTPFINRIFIKEQFRGLGDGKLTLLIWQRQMEERFFDEVMLSCDSENAVMNKLCKELNYDLIGTLKMSENNTENVYKKVLPKPEI